MKSVYFIGAGGIGMSALERYFLSKGLVVAGYDRTPANSQKNSVPREPIFIMKITPNSFRLLVATSKKRSWFIHQPFLKHTRN